MWWGRAGQIYITCSGAGMAKFISSAPGWNYLLKTQEGQFLPQSNKKQTVTLNVLTYYFQKA
jgi:hypothetical protein